MILILITYKVGIPVFGPSALAARIEGSKAFSKDFMKRHKIPTAAYHTFTDFESAKAHILSSYKGGDLVIKASGLAAGKGVLIPETLDQAIKDLESLMISKEFGGAGDEVVIEERLQGEEVSVLSFTDGYTIVPCPGAQDHKRVFEDDKVRQKLSPGLQFHLHYIQISNILLIHSHRDPIPEVWVLTPPRPYILKVFNLRFSRASYNPQSMDYVVMAHPS